MRNKLFSRVLAIVLTLVCVLTAVPISAYAAETDVASIGAETRTVKFNTDCLDKNEKEIKVVKTIKFANGEAYKKDTVHYRMSTTDDNGNTVNAYCIEPGVHLYAGDKLDIKASYIWDTVLTDAQQLAIQAAIAFGAEGNYSNLKKSISTLTFGEAYVATQVIVWEFKDGVRSAVAPYALNSGKAGYIDAYCSGGNYPNIKKAYDKIIDSLAKFQKVPEFTHYWESLAPTITLKANYNAETKEWICESVEKYDANGVLSSFPELFGTFDVGNGKVTISRNGNTATISAGNINLDGTAKTLTIESAKSGIPTTNASGKTAELVAYGASGDVQDVVSGYSIDPPKAYLNININTDGSYTRDGRIQKCCYTETEFADDNVNDGEGALSSSENVEGWYFYVEADINFVEAYGVESFILGPTDSMGFTQSLAEYVIENIDPDITHDIPVGIYRFWELGKLKDGADGSDLENDYYFPDNWSPKSRYGDISATGSLRIADTGSFGLNEVSYANNFFKIPLRIFKVNEPNVSVANFFFTATNETTGEVFLLRTVKGTGSAYVVGADGNIDPQYAKYNNEDSVYDNFLPEGKYTLHEIGKIHTTSSLGSTDFENDYAIPAYFDEPVDVSFEVTIEGYKTAQEQGLDTIEVYAYNTVSSYIAIQKKDSDTGEALAGAKYGLFATATAEDPLEELITDENGYAQTEHKYPTGTYLIKELEAPMYYEKNDTVYTVNVVPTVNVDNVVLIDVEDVIIPTTVKIFKHETGKTDIPLKGAVFGLYKDNKCTQIIEQVTTGADGNAIFSPVRPGTYYLKEITAPTYYQKSDAVMKVEVSKTTVQDKVITINIDNPLITSKVMLSKTDKDTGKPLQGAVYGIFSNKLCTNLLEELVTNIEGIAISEDDYEPETVLYIKEITAPDTYLIDDTVYTITMPKSKTENAYMRIEASDTPIPLFIKVYKIDEETRHPLMGAEFALYSDKDCKTSPLETLVTGTDGTVTSANSYKPGTYYIKETKAPTGYIKSDEIFSIVLAPTNEVGKSIGFALANPKGKTHIAIDKVDKDTKEKLAGAVYGLYTDITCSVLLEELTTDENGYAQTKEKYPSNTYFIKEIKAPEGYELDETKHIIYISPEDAVNGTLKGTVVRKTVEDERRPVKIIIVKYDPDIAANGKRLSGAKFGIYEDAECKKLLEEVITDANINGEAISKNDYKIGQTVYLKEHQAPAGYKIREDVIEVKITAERVDQDMKTATYSSFVKPENGEDFVVDMIGNPANKSYIGIKKTDSRTGKLLQGVTFWLCNNSNCYYPYYGSITTNADGYAQSVNLFNPGQTVWIKEANTLNGYYTNDTIYKVTIPYSETDENIVLIEVENDPIITTDITIRKTCQQTKEPVKGALYRLYTDNTTDSSGAITSGAINTQQTDANGIATFKNVEVGKTYYIQEWKMGVPAGYNWNKQIYTVTATEGDNDVEIIEVTNSIKTGSVNILKTGLDNKPLQGVKFEVYRASDNKKILFYTISTQSSIYAYTTGTSASNTYTPTTNTQGKIQLISLPLGDYYLKEVSTLEGYMPYYGKIHFSIELETESNTLAKTINITVPNNPPITWSTGGEGIMPFYYSAIIALTLSAVLLAVPTMKYTRRTKKSH